MSERLYVRHLRGFSTRYWVVKRRCVPLPALGARRVERTSRREWPVDHNYSRKVVEKFGAGAFVPLVPPSALRPLAGWRSPAVSPRSWLVSRAPFKPRRGTGKMFCRVTRARQQQGTRAGSFLLLTSTSSPA